MKGVPSGCPSKSTAGLCVGWVLRAGAKVLILDGDHCTALAFCAFTGIEGANVSSWTLPCRVPFLAWPQEPRSLIDLLSSWSLSGLQKFQIGHFKYPGHYFKKLCLKKDKWKMKDFFGSLLPYIFYGWMHWPLLFKEALVERMCGRQSDFIIKAVRCFLLVSNSEVYYCTSGDWEIIVQRNVKSYGRAIARVHYKLIFPEEIAQHKLNLHTTACKRVIITF